MMKQRKLGRFNIPTLVIFQLLIHWSRFLTDYSWWSSAMNGIFARTFAEFTIIMRFLIPSGFFFFGELSHWW